MIERVTQQVWNWRWASNLSDTSNTKVNFSKFLELSQFLMVFHCFFSLEIVFLYFLKWVCFSPEDLHKIAVLFHNRIEKSLSRRVERTIYHIPTQIPLNSSIWNSKIKTDTQWILFFPCSPLVGYFPHSPQVPAQITFKSVLWLYQGRVFKFCQRH